MFFEALVFIIVVIILIIVFQLKGTVDSKLDFLNIQLENLTQKLNQTAPQPPAPVKIPQPIAIPKEPVAAPVEKPVAVPEKPPVPVAEQIKPPVKQSEKPIPAPIRPSIPPPVNIPAPARVKPSFSERNPDLEKFIGENLFNKIGIVILVLGVGFFLKYAIDKDWINEIGRVCIGFIFGGAMIALAHRMRHSFRAFSSVLIGGGIAILYFTITIAFQQYHLISQTLGFIITILITGFTVLLSVSYNRLELAMFAILGGFFAPFMVSTGHGNYIIVFTYILILNIGMLVLAYFKKWPSINVVCYIFTIILYSAWLNFEVLNTDKKIPPYAGALVFASLFYLVFLAMNVINNLKEKTGFKALEIGMIVSNTFLYYLAGMLILEHFGHGAYRGLFTASLGLVNLAFAYTLYKNEKVDRNLVYLLIGLVLTFISLAAPVQLHGNHITLFWAAESVLLFWFSQKSGIELIKRTSAIILILMLTSLWMDWANIYGAEHLYDQSKENLTPILNKAFITSMVAVISMILYARLLKQETQFPGFGDLKMLKQILRLTTIAIGYFALYLELNYQGHLHFEPIRGLALNSYNFLFIIILFIPVSKSANVNFKSFLGCMALISILIYLFAFNSQTIDLRNSYIQGKTGPGGYLFHYLVTLLALVTLYRMYLVVKNVKLPVLLQAFQWTATFITLYIASMELDHLLVTTQYSATRSIYDIQETSHKTAFPILWGSFALLCIYLGMKWKSKTVRIISITLLGITLLKLFLFDLADLSEGGKIAAFISLGILLLVISFMYQRLKKLILTDHKTEDHDSSQQAD